MKKKLYLDDWIFTKKLSDDKRDVEASIHLKYPDIKPLIKYSPSERKTKIRDNLKLNFNRLIEKIDIEQFLIIGTKSKPTGIKAKMSLKRLDEINKFPIVGFVHIDKMAHAKKKKIVKNTSNFYCVRMTVAIEIEGRKKGLQSIEDRFVLIKANSFDDAYKKVEKSKQKYAEPYLNPDGEIVRWKIESLDDCFITEINSFEDLTNPEGIEVFSSFKHRRLTAEKVAERKPGS